MPAQDLVLTDHNSFANIRETHYKVKAIENWYHVLLKHPQSFHENSIQSFYFFSHDSQRSLCSHRLERLIDRNCQQSRTTAKTGDQCKQTTTSLCPTLSRFSSGDRCSSLVRIFQHIGKLINRYQAGKFCSMRNTTDKYAYDVCHWKCRHCLKQWLNPCLDYHNDNIWPREVISHNR